MGITVRDIKLSAAVYVCLIVFLKNLFFAAPAHGETIERVDLTLGLAYELALSNDETLKAAESDIVIADETRRQAHRSRGVTLSIEHDTRWTELQNESEIKSFSNVITATYPLYTGGMIEAGISASNYGLASANENLDLVRLDVRLSVASAYFTMLRSEYMVRLAKNSTERLESHVRNVESQHRNGRVNKADLLRSEVELVNAKQTMSQAEKEYRVAIKNMNNIIGLPLDTELSFDKEMPYESFAHTLEECVTLALLSHPSITIADLAEKRAEAAIETAKSEAKPNVSLYAAQSLLSENEWPGIKDDSFYVGFSAEYKLSDSGVVSSKVKGAREELKKARVAAQSARDTVIFSVTRDFMEVNEAKSRLDIIQVGLDKSRETYRIALARYKEGVGTNLDVLDAESALNQVDSNYTQALCDYNIALARMENSIGVAVTAMDEMKKMTRVGGK